MFLSLLHMAVFEEDQAEGVYGRPIRCSASEFLSLFSSVIQPLSYLLHLSTLRFKMQKISRSMIQGRENKMGENGGWAK